MCEKGHWVSEATGSDSPESRQVSFEIASWFFESIKREPELEYLQLSSCLNAREQELFPSACSLLLQGTENFHKKEIPGMTT